MNEELAKTDVCRNCGSPDIRIYCAACGQKTMYRRFKLKDSLFWLFAKIFDMEQGFFHTTLELLKRPEKVIGNYLQGATRPYSHPFRFIFLWSTISTVISYWIGAFDIITEQLSAANPDPTSKAINDFIYKYINFIIVGMVPFLALWAKLFYRKHKLNLTEHIIINCFAMGASTAVGLVFNFLYFIPSLVGWVMAFSFFIITFVTGRVYSRYFKENIFLSVFKYILIYLLGTLTVMVVGSIVAILVVIIGKFLGFA